MRHAVGGDRLRGRARPAIRDRDALRDPPARGRLAARRWWRPTTTGCTSEVPRRRAGSKALVAEIVAGELARALGLPVPEIVLVELDPALGARRARPRDPGPDRGQRRAERRRWTSCPARCRSTRPRRPAPTPELAADVVWLDALITNVDRTPRNPNLLVWHGRAVADRPRRRAVSSTTRGGDWARARAPFAAIARSRAAAVRGARSRRPTCGWRCGSATRRSRRRGLPCRSEADADARLPCYLRARLGAPRGWAEEVGCPEPVPVRDRARRPARRARRAHERRRRVLLPPAAVPGGAHRARRGAAGALAPELDVEEVRRGSTR